jgi:hypothetical protein
MYFHHICTVPHVYHMHHICLVAQCSWQTSLVRLTLWQSPCQSGQCHVRLGSLYNQHAVSITCITTHLLHSSCVPIWIQCQSHTHIHFATQMTWAHWFELWTSHWFELWTSHWFGLWTTWMKYALCCIGNTYESQTTRLSHRWSYHRETDTCRPPISFLTPPSYFLTPVPTSP